MKVFGIVGWRGAEKTELVLALVKYFSDQGIKVSVVKHWLQGAEQELGEGDRFTHSDCVETLMASPDKWTLLQDVPHQTEFDLEAAVASLKEVDLVLVDGFKASDHKKLLVVHPQDEHQQENAQLLLTACPNVVAVALPESGSIDTDLIQFPISAVEEIGRFISESCQLE